MSSITTLDTQSMAGASEKRPSTNEEGGHLESGLDNGPLLSQSTSSETAKSTGEDLQTPKYVVNCSVCKRSEFVMVSLQV